MRAAILAALALAGCVGEITGGGPGPDGDAIVDTPDGKVGGRDLRRLTVREYDNTVRDVFGLGEAWPGAGLPPDQRSAIGFDNDRALLVIDEARGRDFAAAAERVADTVMAGGLASIAACAAPGRACVVEIVARFGPRLLRHDLDAAAQARYLDAYDRMIARAATPADAEKWTLVALLSSPHFLYRSELGEPSGQDDGLYTLTGAELATALAYDFAASPPSAELLARGASGALATPEARVAEARRLLATPRGRAVVDDFLARWLQYTEVKTIAKDATVVADFAAVRDDMAEETHRFLADLFYDRQGGVAELFTSSQTFLSPALAAHYGLPAPAEAFGAVTRPPDQAIGVLAQGSLLARFALTDSTSPPQRGAFIRRRFLCQDLPPPPPNVGAPPVPQPGLTTRERYTVVTSGAACSGCHRLTNDIGFALEHFDAAGRYRATEDGLPIDPSGTIVGFGAAGDVRFADATELAAALARSPEVAACVGGRMAAYTYGMAEASVLAAPAQVDALIDGRASLYEFYAQLAGAAHFGTRSGR